MKAQNYKPGRRWQTRKTKSLTPPPGLTYSRSPKPSRLQKNAAEILAPAWDSMDENVKAKLTELGINPTLKATKPDLTDVVNENLANLSGAVKGIG